MIEDEVDEFPELSDDEEAGEHSDTELPTKCYKLHPKHPDVKTHVLILRKRAVVPNVIGPRIPDLNELDDDDGRLGDYAITVMCLLRGFRGREELGAHDGSHTSKYLMWRRSTSFGEYEENLL